MACVKEVVRTLRTLNVMARRFESHGNRPQRGFMFACLLLSLSWNLFPQSRQSPDSPKADAKGNVGSEACEKCHEDIYRSYRQTPMAQASGPAIDNLVPATYTHRLSGVQYEIYKSSGKAWLSFNRPGDPMVHGKRELLYYIGEGRRGRTYLFSVDGFAFEAPVNWYADRQTWDMPPAFSETREIPMNLPAVMSCLACHGSGTQPPLEGSENRYSSPIFTHPGVSCERCHGPGKAHLSGGPIVNPSKLDGKLRDQICMQCHLEGNIAIERAGRHLYDYQPGGDLFEDVRYFVLSVRDAGSLRATSQFEALAASACKKKSGDAMSCTSCHDPHQVVIPQERVAFYRARCVACHGSAFASKHHRDHPDCTSCHMPSSLSSDIAHTEVTDHRILRRPQQEFDPPSVQSEVQQLAVFPPSMNKDASLRDLALAWQVLANREMNDAQHRAERFLRKALEESPSDPALLTALAYAEQKRGADNEARRLYSEALEHDPESLDAATNLGVLEAEKGHTAAALKLWQGAFEQAPGRSAIGMNLARTLCGARRYDDARNIVMRVLEFNPDLGTAKNLLRELNRTPPNCGQ